MAEDEDPRIERTRRVVRRAVLDELRDAGYGGFSVESVAARSGVAKSTLYRHWSGRRDMVRDALAHRSTQPVPSGGGAHPLEDVGLLLQHLADAMRDPDASRTLASLVEAAEHDPELAGLFHEDTGRRFSTLRDVLADGVAAGTLSPDLDPGVVATALSGAVVHRRLLGPSPMTSHDVARLVDQVLGPWARPRTPRTA